MINSNPETVSTVLTRSDLLFFEPLTLEDTLNVIERLNGRVQVVWKASKEETIARLRSAATTVGAPASADFVAASINL